MKEKNMREQLLEIINFTNDLKILDKVLVTTDSNETFIESMDANRNVIMKGKLNPIENLTGKFALYNMDTLKGYCNFANYKTDEAKITVKRKEMAGETFPEEFIFTGGGTKSTFRCALASTITNQPSFKKANWDLDISISKSKITEFSQMASILKNEQSVYIELVNGDLIFNIGSPTSTENHASIVMAENVEGEITNLFQWNIQYILSIAKLSSGDVHFRMLSKGLINIHITSEYGDYEYYLPRIVVEEA